MWKLKLLERRSVLYSLLNHEFKSENEHQGVNEKSFLLDKKKPLLLPVEEGIEYWCAFFTVYSHRTYDHCKELSGSLSL